MKETKIPQKSERIKEQIEHWLFKYHNKLKAEFKGSEVFTLFDLLYDELKSWIKERINLRENELPVLSR